MPKPHMKYGHIAAEISTEELSGIKPSDIQLRDEEQYNALVQADEDPLQVLVKVPVGNGNKGLGYYYGENVLKQMAEQINSHIIPGYHGHTPFEDRPFVKRDIATYWLGAIYSEEQKATFVRGLVAKNEEKLKLEIRTKIITQVSLYGPIEVADDGVTVETIELESLDWTPPHMAGMDTELVATEMKNEEDTKMKFGKDVKKEDLKTMVKEISDDQLMELNQIMYTFNEIKSKVAEVHTLEEDELQVEDVLKHVVASLDSVDENAEEGEDEDVDNTDVAEEMVSAKVKDATVKAVVMEMMGDVSKKTKSQISAELATIMAKESIKMLVKESKVNKNHTPQNTTSDDDGRVSILKRTKRNI